MRVPVIAASRSSGDLVKRLVDFVGMLCCGFVYEQKLWITAERLFGKETRRNCEYAGSRIYGVSRYRINALAKLCLIVFVVSRAYD